MTVVSVQRLFFCFNPSDGLGVVRTNGNRNPWNLGCEFQSLGRVGGGSDAEEKNYNSNSVPFQSLGRVGGGSDSNSRPSRVSGFKFQSLGRVGGGSDVESVRSGFIQPGFNPSDGLGVVRTRAIHINAPLMCKFQSLGRVGGGSDPRRQAGGTRRAPVSIPRTGWGWFGPATLDGDAVLIAVSIPRTGWGWFGRHLRRG